MNLETISSHIYFDVPSYEAIISDIENQVMNGSDIGKLDELLGVQKEEFKGALKRLFNSIGFQIPDKETAGVNSARYMCKQIIDGKILPYQGAKIIWHDIENNCDNGFESKNKFSGFVGLASQYEDFFDVENIEFYGEEKCKKIQKNLEIEILEEAREFLKE